MFRGISWSLCLAVVLGLTMGGVAAAQGAALKFEDGGPLTIEPGASRDLTLLNNSRHPLVAALVAIDRSGAAADSVSITPTSAGLHPGGASTFKISVPMSSPEFDGYVVAAAYSAESVTIPNAIARRRLQVASQLELLEPLLSRWSMTSYRWKPVGKQVENEVIPMRAPTECRDNQTKPVGAVTSGERAALVSAECVEAPILGSAVGMRLSVPGIRNKPGDYSGVIDFVPEESGKGELEVTVRQTDFFLVPAAFLLGGICLALLTALQAARLNVLRRLEEETWLLQSEAAEAEHIFGEKARRTSWAAYSLQPDLDKALVQIRGYLKILGRSLSRLNKPGGRYQVQVNRLNNLQTAVAAWPIFADRLSTLDAAVKVIRSEVPTYRADRPDESPPAFLDPTTKLLEGEPLKEHEAMIRMDAVEAATQFVQEWRNHARTAASLSERAEMLEKNMKDNPAVKDEHVESLARATGKIHNAYTELWRAKDSADYRAKAVAVNLEAASSELDQLGRFMKSSGRGNWVGAAIAKGLETTATGSALERILTEQAPWPTQATPKFGARRRRRNGLVFLGLSVLTMWSGLNLLYFDRPFGTVRDYLTILLWGFGAQAVLEVTATALRRALDRGGATVPI